MLRVLNEERGEELQVKDRYANIEDESIAYPRADLDIKIDVWREF